VPQLVLEIDGQERVLDSGRSYTVGRDPASDLVIDDAGVSSQHATISFDGEVWELAGRTASDGIFAQGVAARRVRLDAGVSVNLGDPEKGPRLVCSGTRAAADEAAKPPRKRTASARKRAASKAAPDKDDEAAEAKPAARKRAAARKASGARAEATAGGGDAQGDAEAAGTAEAKPATRKRAAARKTAPEKAAPAAEAAAGDGDGAVAAAAAPDGAPTPAVNRRRRKAAAAAEPAGEAVETRTVETTALAEAAAAKPTARKRAAARKAPAAKAAVVEAAAEPEASAAPVVPEVAAIPEVSATPETAEVSLEAAAEPAVPEVPAVLEAPAVPQAPAAPAAAQAVEAGPAPDFAEAVEAPESVEPIEPLAAVPASAASVEADADCPVPPAPAAIAPQPAAVAPEPVREVHAPARPPARPRRFAAAPQPTAPPQQFADPARAESLRRELAPRWSESGGRRIDPNAVRSLPSGAGTGADAGAATTRIGRAADNDIVVDDLQVSLHHAELRRLPDGGYEVVDLGSHHGVFLNGKRVARRQAMLDQDRLTVGHSSFVLVDGELHEYTDDGAVSFSAQRLTVEVGEGENRKVLLDDVSFAVAERSLVAVIGPSGCGKSTLLRALTGYRPADRGAVVYDGLGLYQHFAELRSRIGLVPQSEILHRELTVRKALGYAAELRFPGDTRREEREARIDEVLESLRLTERAGNRITALSGGQQKRVSVALELLTKPSLIFLDEPTSGLDPGMDREVMQTLRDLADEGRTVLVVTHSVAQLELCDQLLVLAPGGRTAYFGPPSEALHFFGYEDWADVFQAFENYPDHDWANRYRDSIHYRLYSATAQEEAAEDAAAAARQEPVVPPKPQAYRAQLWTLIRRYLAVIASDRGFMALSVLLPLVLGGVSLVIPDKGCGLTACATAGGRNDYARLILMVVAFSACLSGSASSVRELIKERAVYERERATGLSRSAYLMSKVIVLGGICLLQGVIISAVAFEPRALPAHGLIFGSAVTEMAIGAVLLGFVSMMVGLAISALVKTSEKTMPLLVMFAIVQMVFTGAIFQVFGKPGLEQVAWLMPARWGLAALGNPLDLAHISPVVVVRPPETPPIDDLWTHSAGFYLLNCFAMIALSVGLAFLVMRFQRRHEPEVMRRG